MSAPVLVRVYNLTDVHTSNLEKHRLLDQHIAIGTRMCAPGEFVEQEDTVVLRENCKHLVTVGALALGALPPPYVAARTAAAAQASGPLAVHIQHLDVSETKVAADPPLVPVAEGMPVVEPAPTPAPEPAPVPIPAPTPVPATQGKNRSR